MLLQAIRLCMKTTRENIETNDEKPNLSFWTTEDLRWYVRSCSHTGNRDSPYECPYGPALSVAVAERESEG